MKQKNQYAAMKRKNTVNYIHDPLFTHLLIYKPSRMNDLRCLTNLSEGAKHPTHNDNSIQPLAWEDFDGLTVSCLHI